MSNVCIMKFAFPALALAMLTGCQVVGKTDNSSQSNPNAMKEYLLEICWGQRLGIDKHTVAALDMHLTPEECQKIIAEHETNRPESGLGFTYCYNDMSKKAYPSTTMKCDAGYNPISYKTYKRIRSM